MFQVFALAKSNTSERARGIFSGADQRILQRLGCKPTFCSLASYAWGARGPHPRMLDWPAGLLRRAVMLDARRMPAVASKNAGTNLQAALQAIPAGLIGGVSLQAAGARLARWHCWPLLQRLPLRGTCGMGSHVGLHRKPNEERIFSVTEPARMSCKGQPAVAAREWLARWGKAAGVSMQCS